VVAGHGE
jgi:hypothetical protein